MDHGILERYAPWKKNIAGGSRVNNAIGRGLQLLNDKKTMSLTTDLDLVFTA